MSLNIQRRCKDSLERGRDSCEIPPTVPWEESQGLDHYFLFLPFLIFSLSFLFFWGLIGLDRRHLRWILLPHSGRNPAELIFSPLSLSLSFLFPSSFFLLFVFSVAAAMMDDIGLILITILCFPLFSPSF